MSAEGILDNPAIFAPALKLNENLNEDEINDLDIYIRNITKLQLAKEYIEYAKQYPTKMKSIIFHIRRIIKQELLSYQLMDECLNAQNIDTINSIVELCCDYKGKSFIIIIIIKYYY